MPAPEISIKFAQRKRRRREKLDKEERPRIGQDFLPACYSVKKYREIRKTVCALHALIPSLITDS